MRTKYGFELRFVQPFSRDWHQVGNVYNTIHEAAMMLAICLEITCVEHSQVEGRLIHIYLPDDTEPEITITPFQ